MLRLDKIHNEQIPVEEALFLLERIGFQIVERSDFSTTLVKKTVNGLRSIDIIDSIIRNDKKITTYKLALLRAMGDLSGSTFGQVSWNDDGYVSVSIDLVVQKWIRYYWPIVTAENVILQGQKSEGKQDITFRNSLTELTKYWEQKKDGWLKFDKAFKQGSFNQIEASLYSEACKSIKAAIQQPIKFAGNSKTGDVFGKGRNKVRLKADLWKEFALMGRWLDDSLIVRWAELSETFNKSSDGVNAAYVFSRLLMAYNKERDMCLSRNIYNRIKQENGVLRCVWSDLILNDFDIDHAIPFAVWRNNALWNLLPSNKSINRKKSDKLPERLFLQSRENVIREYWDQIYERESLVFEKEVSLFLGDGDWSANRSKEMFQTFCSNVEMLAIQNAAERWSP